MTKSQFDSLYIPTKAGQHAHSIRRALTLLLSDWLEFPVTCKIWRATRSWELCTHWSLPTKSVTLPLPFSRVYDALRLLGPLISKFIP